MPTKNVLDTVRGIANLIPQGPDLSFLDTNQDAINQALTSTLSANLPTSGFSLKNLFSKASDFFGGPMGLIGFGVKTLEDNIAAARSQFDINAFKDTVDQSFADFNQTAGSANTTSDLLNLQSQVPDFNDYIDNQGYRWNGNILSGIGALIGNRRTEDAKQSARNMVSQYGDSITGGLNVASKRVSDRQYMQGMANFLNNAAMGGPLSTHGSDFTDDLIRVDVGGTHEQNPLGGVPAGVDPQGIPNLVEEGETIWEDYVFSDRLKAPKDYLKKYKLGGDKKKGADRLSFSDAARKVAEKSGVELRPNDPISKRTRDAMLTELEEEQEDVRMKKQQKDFIKALSEMSPEEFEAVMLQNPGTQIPAETEVPPQGMNEEVPAEQPLMQEPTGFEPQGLQGFALGGHILDGEHSTSRKQVGPLAGPVRLPGVGVIDYRNLYDSEVEMHKDDKGRWWVDGRMVGTDEGAAQRYARQVADARATLNMSDTIDEASISTERSSMSTPQGRAVGSTGVIRKDTTFNTPYLEIDYPFEGQTTPNKNYDIEGVGRFLPDDYAPYFGRIPAPERGGSNKTTNNGLKTVSTDEHGPFLNTKKTTKPSTPRGGTQGTDTVRTGIGRTPSSPIIPSWMEDVDWVDPILTENSPAVENTPINLGRDNFVVSKMAIPNRTASDNTLPTWMRYAPIVGGGLSVLSDIFSQPDYSRYEGLAADARRLQRPVNIPVTTIGNRLRRNPFDERLIVNQANQNFLAGLRSTLDTAGGNRAFRQYATSNLIRNSQNALSDIARNSFLANRQDALQTADFNRATDLYNMNAINQRNLTQGQLNSNRDFQGFNARMNALNALENARRYDDQLVSADLTGFLQSLGNLGRENFIFNQIDARRREGLSPVSYNGDKSGIWQFYGADGGKKKTKKRRF